MEPPIAHAVLFGEPLLHVDGEVAFRWQHDVEGLVAGRNAAGVKLRQADHLRAFIKGFGRHALG